MKEKYMQIGLLIQSKILDADVPFYGNLKTMEITIRNFELKRNPYKKEDKHPDYNIYVKSVDGSEVSIGMAWHHKYVRNGIDGELISLTFDDPSFSSSLRVTAFKGEEEYRWPITGAVNAQRRPHNKTAPPFL